MSVIRLSNHCTNPSNWENRYGNNNPSLNLTKKEVQKCRGNYDRLPNKCFKKTFFSFVIFDPVADGIQQCTKVQTNGIFVNQFIYDATKMTDGMITEIKNKIKQIASNGILEEKIEKDNNTKTQNNMKRKIRLTESQLHSMISESVKQVLSELDWKTYDSAMRKSAERNENYSRANVPFRTKYKGEDKDGNEIWGGTQSNYGFSDNSEHSREYQQFIQQIYDCFRNFNDELNGIINDYHPTDRYEYSFFEQYYKGKDGIEGHLDEIRQDIDILNGEVFDPNFWA